MKNMYPNDGGLKEPVRPYNNIIAKIIVKYFKNRRVGQPDNR